MADPTTTNIKLAVPTRGSDVGTWDAPLNGDMTILDACLGSVTSVALSNVNVTLTTTQAQSNVINFTGILTGNVQVNFPAIYKSWTILNKTTGNFFVQLVQGGSGIGAPPGTAVDIFSDGTTLQYRNLGAVGTYWDYAGAAVPLWVSCCSVPPFLKCDGSTFSSGTYPQLATLLGTTTLPDTKGRIRASLDEGTGRITIAGSGIDGTTRFAAGGSQNVTLDTTMIPAHTHTGTTGGQSADHTHTGAYTPIGTASAPGGPGAIGQQTPLSTGGTSNDHTHSFTTNSTGGGAFHYNMQPTYIGGITMIRAA